MPTGCSSSSSSAMAKNSTLRSMGLYDCNASRKYRGVPNGKSKMLSEMKMTEVPSMHQRVCSIAVPPGGREAARARIEKYNDGFSYHNGTELPWTPNGKP